MTNQSNQKIPHVHFENLDALRFLAAFSVFLFHYFADIKALCPSLKQNDLFQKFQQIADKGSLGVNFFFVLSGFLITYLILHNRQHRGYFSLGKFLVRRTLRIWPLYFIVVFTGFILFPLLFTDYFTTHDPWMYMVFLANIDEINNGLYDPINFLTSPWSVAVEEQFYLFWGVSLFVIFKIKALSLVHFIILLYVLSFVFRWYYVHQERIIYYHTFSVCQDILTGAFVGLALFEGKKWLERLKKLKMIWVLLIYGVGFAACLAKNKIFIGDLLVLERFVLSSFFAFIILDQIRGDNSFFKFGRIKLFNYLGKISYGFYMYHLIVMYLIILWINSLQTKSFSLLFLYLGASLIGIITLASLSYYLIERPLLKLKPK